MSLSSAKSSNDRLDLTGRFSVVSGGTQGIGAGIAVRLAQLGSSVTIVGRNAEAASKVIQKMNGVSKNPGNQNFDFVQADLSLVKEVKRVAKELETQSQKNNGIDYLILTQGGPPNGQWTQTAEGIETHYAVQVLSRFGLPYLLTKTSSIKESIISIAAPGASTKQFDVEDLEMRKAHEKGIWYYNIPSIGNRDSLAIDAYTLGFQKRFPDLRTLHFFPGLVNTKAFNSFPFPVRQIASVAYPIITRLVGSTPETYCDVPIFLGINPEGKKLGVNFVSQTWKEIKPTVWCQDPDNVEKVWSKLAKTIDETGN